MLPVFLLAAAGCAVAHPHPYAHPLPLPWAQINALGALSPSGTTSATVASGTVSAAASTGTATTSSSNGTLSTSSNSTSTTSSSTGNSTTTGGMIGNSTASGKVSFAGVNIAGFDFGCQIDGTCDTSSTFDVASKGDGIQQMQHFVSQDGLNAFRLPVAWQFLVNNTLGGPLDPTNSAAYDKLVMGCAAVAKMCIIDIHNYARYNGKIIAQDPSGQGPTDAQYASLLSQLATKYANVSNVAFDIMNEPHDIPSIGRWSQSSQAAVTAIRQAGATSQQILIPGTDFTSALTFANKSGPLLLNITNPDGTTNNLMFNVHRYLDSDGSGTHANCVTNNIADSFTPLAAFLRQNNRVAMLTETGGGPNDTSCMQLLCQQNDFINQNSDVFKGVVSWAAGGFDTNYVISERPAESQGSNGTMFTDQPLVKQCIVGKFSGANGQL